MSTPGHNSSDNRLKSLADRIERLMDERSAISREVASILDAAALDGIEPGAIWLEAARARRLVVRQKKVYFAHASASDLVKIGVATDAKSRLRSLSGQFGAEFKPLGMIDGNEIEERAIHYQLRASRMRGELFRFTPNAEVIASMIARNSAIAQEAA